MALPAISPTGVHTPWIYPTQTAQGLGLTAAFGAAPSSVNQPLFFQPNRDLSGGRRELWIIATGISTNWGGCEVHVSVDNTTFFQTGAIGRGGVQGALTAAFPTGPDPDTTDTLSVDISQTSGGQIIAGTMQDADLLLTLAVVDTEVVAYTSATLTGTGLYDLGTYLRRGAYCTPVSSHAAGAQFGLLNNGVYVHEYPTNLVGTVLYFKFPSFNTMGAALEDIATVPTYAWVLLPQPPEVPIGLAATCETCGACANVALQWEENLSCDHVTFYHVFRATGTGQPFSAALPVAAVDALNWLDTGLQLGSAHTYFLLAENEDGFSNPSAGVDVTCGGGAGVPPTGGCDPAIEFGTFERGAPSSGAITRWDAAAEAGTFPIDFQGSSGYAKTAAASTADGIINLIHAGSATQIGAFSFAAAGHTPTFASIGGLVHGFAADDVIEIVWPNPADASLADIALTLWATRDCNVAGGGGAGPPPPPPTPTVVDLPPGTTSWTVPMGVTTLLSVEGVGGGGGAGGWTPIPRTSLASHGAGGAGYVKLTNFAVTPGQVIPVTVGAGGLGAVGSTRGGDGGDTTFKGGYTSGGFTAIHGGGGSGADTLIGTAGNAQGPLGSIKFSGGFGGAPVFNGFASGGGGGGAGGPLGRGANGGTAAVLFHPTDISGGPGGGGASGGLIGQSTPIGTVSGAGGASGDGTPGGAGATSTIVMGTVVKTAAGAGSSGSGGGGGGQAYGATFADGAAGGDGDPSGGGGGGGGGGTSLLAGGNGGDGGQYGGGGGGGAAGGDETRGGSGGDGLIRITY